MNTSTFRLPMPDRHDRREPSEHGGRPARWPCFNARVLVADDNPMNQNIAVRMLKRMGCSGVVAANGDAAIETQARERLDLVLMDCEMPVLDGFMASRRIRRQEAANGGTPRVPIVALTGHSLADVRERCEAAGIDDILLKPLAMEQLARTLARWLPEGLPASAADDDRGTLDPAVLLQLRGFDGLADSGLLARLVSQFEVIGPNLAAAMRNGVGEVDAGAVWRAAHNLKSSAASLGARQLLRFCERTERQARDHGILPSAADLAAIDREIAATTRELRRAIEPPR